MTETQVRRYVDTGLPPGSTWRVVAASTRNAWADMAATFTPVSWIFGWLGRIVAQVIFYAMIGTLLGSPEHVEYLYMGSAVLATAMESLLVISTTTRERYSGTLPLLVASPTRLWPVFLGRSVQWLPSGVATASVALFIIGPAFGVQFSFPAALAVFGALIVVAISTYGFGLALASFVLRHMRLRNWATNLSYTVMMLTCAVSVPLDFWPTWVQVVAHIFPMTEALHAIRDLEFGGATASHIVVDLLIALGTGLVWYVIAAFSFERLAAKGRKDGSIEFAE